MFLNIKNSYLQMNQSAFRTVAMPPEWSYDGAENGWLTDEISVKHLDELGEGYI
jgi:hypothetical protein